MAKYLIFEIKPDGSYGQFSHVDCDDDDEAVGQADSYRRRPVAAWRGGDLVAELPAAPQGEPDS